MKSFKFLKVVLVALIFSVALSGRANADATGFTLVNHSGKDIVELHVMAASSIDLYTNYLGVSVLRNGDSVRINYDTTSSSFYNIGVKFSDGRGIYVDGFDLLNARQIIVNSEESIQAR